MARRGENIRKRKDGRWEARYFITDDKTSTRKCVCVYGKTYTEARNKRMKKLAEIHTNLIFTEKSSSTGYYFTDLANEWIEQLQFQVKPSTLVTYRHILNKHLIPEFSKLDVTDLNIHLINSFFKQKEEDGFAISTLQLISVVFRKIIQFAETKNIHFHPKIQIILNKKSVLQVQLMKENDYLKLKQYLMHPTNTKDVGLLLAIYTGIRLGELSGLTWKNINLEYGEINICQTVSRIPNLNYQSGRNQSKTILSIRTPKTSSSYRKIPIPDILNTILKSWSSFDDCFLMSGTTHCMEPRSIQRYFNKILNKLNIPHIKIHSLRHHFSTMWIENAFDTKNLAEILGHSSVKTTLDIYVHGNDKQKKKYMNNIIDV